MLATIFYILLTDFNIEKVAKIILSSTSILRAGLQNDTKTSFSLDG